MGWFSKDDKVDDDVQVEGLEIGGMTGGTVKIGGREVQIGRDGKPVDDKQRRNR